jgi:hypothetical protein
MSAPTSLPRKSWPDEILANDKHQVLQELVKGRLGGDNRNVVMAKGTGLSGQNLDKKRTPKYWQRIAANPINENIPIFDVGQLLGGEMTSAKSLKSRH